jgi:trimethylamine--corrinoid protein Co-methyltransferase
MGLSDSKSPDYQAGSESSAGIVLAALSGVNNVSGPGMLEFEACQSLEKLVLDHEACAYALRLVEGIVPRDDVLGFDVLRAGLEAGHFMSLDHTLKWYKEEGYYPSAVVDRDVRENWEAKGKRDALASARERVAGLLEDGVPNLLDEARRKDLRAILEADARKHGAGNLPELPL